MPSFEMPIPPVEKQDVPPISAETPQVPLPPDAMTDHYGRVVQDFMNDGRSQEDAERLAAKLATPERELTLEERQDIDLLNLTGGNRRSS